MKAVIKIATADKDFNQDQMAIIRRVMLVLVEHNLSVVLNIKKKEIVLSDIKLWKVG